MAAYRIGQKKKLKRFLGINTKTWWSGFRHKHKDLVVRIQDFRLPHTGEHHYRGCRRWSLLLPCMSICSDGVAAMTVPSVDPTCHSRIRADRGHRHRTRADRGRVDQIRAHPTLQRPLDNGINYCPFLTVFLEHNIQLYPCCQSETADYASSVCVPNRLDWPCYSPCNYKESVQSCKLLFPNIQPRCYEYLLASYTIHFLFHNTTIVCAVTNMFEPEIIVFHAPITFFSHKKIGQNLHIYVRTVSLTTSFSHRINYSLSEKFQHVSLVLLQSPFLSWKACILKGKHAFPYLPRSQAIYELRACFGSRPRTPPEQPMAAVHLGDFSA